MKIVRNKLVNKLNIRTEKDFPIEGIEFIDIMPLFLQKNTLSEISNKFEEELKNFKHYEIFARGFRRYCFIKP